VLTTPNNNISMGMEVQNTMVFTRLIGMSLTTVCLNKDPNFLGSMLFSRGCSGTRVVATNTTKQLAHILFEGYGAHSKEYPCSYLTVAASIGIQKDEVDSFIKRLDKTLKEFTKKA
jgi:O-phospho-L-seryl-tRNASec:L-selenocysteinyl-tRNA synthase